MSLDNQISLLATAIGTEIKTKQDNLISGDNIKTINNQSILGSGNISILGGGGSSAVISSTVLDFGTSGVVSKLFTINDANLTVGLKVSNIMYTPTSIIETTIKESVDDDEFDSLEFSIRNVSVGSFQILAKSNGSINNKRTIQYTIQ